MEAVIGRDAGRFFFASCIMSGNGRVEMRLKEGTSGGMTNTWLAHSKSVSDFNVQGKM